MMIGVQNLFIFLIGLITTYLEHVCSLNVDRRIYSQNTFFKNRLITDFSLWTKSDIASEVDCASECGGDSKCVSFFYNRATDVCTGHAVKFYGTEPSQEAEETKYFTTDVDKRDCAEILSNDKESADGVYIINPLDGNGAIRVYCDMSTEGGGWTVGVQNNQLGNYTYATATNGTTFTSTCKPMFVASFNKFDVLVMQVNECHSTNILIQRKVSVKRKLTGSSKYVQMFQRREDGSVDFYLNWADYKAGFGNPSGEFWLGNDYTHRLSNARSSVLRIDMVDQGNQTGYAKYTDFYIDNETDKYRLHINVYTGDRGDSLTRQNNDRFSTKDQDNDAKSSHCAQESKGAWWYDRCHDSNLNGDYDSTTFSQCISWYTWLGHEVSLKKTEMKLRPN